jgi:two-component system, OmpR family, sensor histidine kinase BaeS
VTAERAGRHLGSLGWRLLAAFALVAVGAVGLVVAAALVGTGRGIDQAAESGRARVAVAVAAAVADAYRAAGGWDGADLAEAEALAADAGARLVVIAADGTIVTGAGTTTAPSVGPTTAAAGGAPLSRAVPARIPAASQTPGRATTPGPTGSGTPGGTSGGGTASPHPSASGTDRPGDGSGTAPPGGSPTASPQVPSAGVPVVVDGVPVGVVGLVFGTDPAATARDVAWRWIAVAAAAALVLALVAGLVVTRRIARPLLAVAGTAQAFAAGDREARTGITGPGEIGTVARSVDDMADTVARSESSQRRLASNVAHELRTPLAALQVGLEELRDGLVEPDPELLTGLHDQALRLGRIVDDLTALSSAEATAFSLRWADVDLAALAASETAAQEPRLRAAGLTVTTETAERVWVEGDADRLRQVLANLLSNAARYCRPGDAVRVSVVARDRVAQLAVRDTGPGIAPADLPHVFDRFWRGTAGGGAQGLGLGLAVVRELVAAHHGTVRVESDGTSGTSVVVELPLRPGPG